MHGLRITRRMFKHVLSNMQNVNTKIPNARTSKQKYGCILTAIISTSAIYSRGVWVIVWSHVISRKSLRIKLFKCPAPFYKAEFHLQICTFAYYFLKEFFLLKSLIGQLNADRPMKTTSLYIKRM